MTMRLLYKFLISYIIIAMFIAAFFILAAWIFVYSNFNEFIAETELAKLNHFEEVLREEYRIHQGWDHFRTQPWLWHVAKG